ncbi:hypothetical protein E1B28_004642 [Marasmius oreades]|uniref:F-box domain-containing protein n=1 Tax=Marasmius oreades TaxID=181124 RepID=A0A9P7UZ51_9AGAR|nr:uncharacterized protein E1B28_004642 [Marasmius oreades]KAG7097276.1 hypothetical protein E1B28_004642 [Marasmius oreades]
MSLQSLPQELLDNVSQFLHPQDLARLLRTCSQCLYPAHRALYRHLSISSASHNLTALVTIVKKPHLARHVKSFSIELDSGATVLRSYYRSLSFALGLMTGLGSLRLAIDPDSSWVLAGVHPASLTRFSSSFPLDHHVTEFLQGTPALIELELDSPHVFHTYPFSSSLQILPNLEQFSGSCEAAEAIVPGRPVHSVQLSTGDVDENVVDQLALSSTNIVILMATSSLPAPRLLRLLSRRMQHLVYLRMMTTYTLNDVPNGDVNFYESVGEALSDLPDLQAFELCGMHWGSLKKHEKDDHEKPVWQAQPLNVSEFSVDESFDTEIYSDLFLGL